MVSEPLEPVAGNVPFLMYHSIDSASAPGFRRFVVSPDDFAAQMDYLDTESYHTLTAGDLVRYRSCGHQLPSRAVVLTFDDAFTDFAEAALPILRKHGFRATLFVPTGYVGATARWLGSCGEAGREVLSWQTLNDLSSEGVEIAAHSHSHPQLDRIPRAGIEDEVRRCKALLENRLGLPIEGFAYPFGYWNRGARAAVAAAGFQYACAVAELTSAPNDHVLTLPRLTVSRGLGVAGLAGLLRAPSSSRLRYIASGKRIAWRTLRQGVRAIGGDPQEGAHACI